MLTEKCKQDFEEWYRINNYPNKFHAILHFDALQLSMQWGVYQDFFDSVKMQIYIKPTADERWSVYIDFFGHCILTDYIYCDTRQEARKAAIEKANEIYNEN